MKIGFFSLLTLIFITLKLTGIINWAWIWVLLPLWAPIGFVVTIIIILVGIRIFF